MIISYCVWMQRCAYCFSLLNQRFQYELTIRPISNFSAASAILPDLHVRVQTVQTVCDWAILTTIHLLSNRPFIGAVLKYIPYLCYNHQVYTSTAIRMNCTLCYTANSKYFSTWKCATLNIYCFSVCSMSLYAFFLRLHKF